MSGDYTYEKNRLWEADHMLLEADDRLSKAICIIDTFGSKSLKCKVSDIQSSITKARERLHKNILEERWGKA